jgi:hypothetical protein
MKTNLLIVALLFIPCRIASGSEIAAELKVCAQILSFAPEEPRLREDKIAKIGSLINDTMPERLKEMLIGDAIRVVRGHIGSLSFRFEPALVERAKALTPKLSISVEQLLSYSICRLAVRSEIPSEREKAIQRCADVKRRGQEGFCTTRQFWLPPAIEHRIRELATQFEKVTGLKQLTNALGEVAVCDFVEWAERELSFEEPKTGEDS